MKTGFLSRSIENCSKFLSISHNSFAGEVRKTKMKSNEFIYSFLHLSSLCLITIALDTSKVAC